jgi:CheY-like chemotaxis protein
MKTLTALIRRSRAGGPAFRVFCEGWGCSLAPRDLDEQSMIPLPAPVLRRMLPTVPIILSTLHDNRTLQREAFSVGVSAVVSKAVGLKTLVNRAEDLLAATHR